MLEAVRVECIVSNPPRRDLQPVNPTHLTSPAYRVPLLPSYSVTEELARLLE